jgi:hypothetical protein
MSRFSNEIARKLALNAFRYRVRDYDSPEEQSEEEQAKGEFSAPLMGKENKLLDALRVAEKIYDDCLEEFLCLQKIRELNSSFPVNCQRLATHLERTLLCWERMGDSQLELTFRASDCKHPKETVQRFDETLRQMLSCAQMGAKEKPFSLLPGPPAGIGRNKLPLAPLIEFTKAVREFWLNERIGTSFAYTYTSMDHKGRKRREATSPAARLVWGAAKFLDARCSLGNVREAMEAASKNPELRKDIFG